MSFSRLILSALILLLVLVSNTNSLICEDLIASGKSETELIKEIDSKMAKLKNELG